MCSRPRSRETPLRRRRRCNSSQVAHSYQTRFTYLSGISYDGKNIWITEYDKKQLHRLNPNLLAAWSRGDFKASRYGDTIEAVATPNPAVDPGASTADPAAMKELLKKLREDPYGTRAAAEELTGSARRNKPSAFCGK